MRTKFTVSPNPALPRRLRVLIADDHPIMREGIKRIIDECGDIEILGEASNGNEVLTMLDTETFDQVILDLSMPGRSGIELIRQIRKQNPSVPILVLTMYSEAEYALRAIRAGAQGYLNKDCAYLQLIQAIRKLASGHPYISSEVAEQLVASLCLRQNDLPHQALSDREFQVFTLLVEGKTLSEVAQQLYLSIKTVSTHKTNLMTKMRIHTFSELIQYAVKNHLTSFEH